jgi:hypothetical protein
MGLGTTQSLSNSFKRLAKLIAAEKVRANTPKRFSYRILEQMSLDLSKKLDTRLLGKAESPL